MSNAYTVADQLISLTQSLDVIARDVQSDQAESIQDIAQRIRDIVDEDSIWVASVVEAETEEAVLFEFANNIDEAIQRLNEMDDEGIEADYDEENFRISINNVGHDFILGGPQIDSLYEFIDILCKENGYDFSRITGFDLVE